METAAYALKKKTTLDSVMPRHSPNIEDRSLLSGQHSHHHLLFAHLTASVAFIFLLIHPSNQYSHLHSGFCLPSSETSNICARTSLVSPLPCFFKPCLSQTILFSCFTAFPRKVLPASVPSASLRTESLFVFLLEHESSPALLSYICVFLLAQNQELEDSFTQLPFGLGERYLWNQSATWKAEVWVGGSDNHKVLAAVTAAQD